MSVSDEEPYQTIFASLKHPIRRRILRMLSKNPMTFSEMLDVLGVSNSFLTYHLENLGELVGKVDGGKYRLSSFGEAAMATLTKVEDIPTTSPQQSLRTRPRKIIAKNVPIVLGIVCILLIAGLAGTIAYYTLTIRDKESELSSANNTINQLNSNITSLKDQIVSDSATITSLEQIVSLKESTVVLADVDVILDSSANSSTPIILNNTEAPESIILPYNLYNASQILTKVVVNYSGYIVVNISRSDSNSLFVELNYSSNGFNYNNTMYVGSTGSAVFPVLPTTTLDVIVGHTDPLFEVYYHENGGNAVLIPTATVTVVYLY